MNHKKRIWRFKFRILNILFRSYTLANYPSFQNYAQIDPLAFLFVNKKGVIKYILLKNVALERHSHANMRWRLKKWKKELSKLLKKNICSLKQGSTGYVSLGEGRLQMGSLQLLDF